MPREVITRSRNHCEKFYKASMLVFITLWPSFSARSAVAESLAIKRGVYVQEQSSCKEAPNAATLVWDGKGLSGAHSSGCTSSVVSHESSHVVIATSCAALGDGSPAPETFRQKNIFTRLSRSKLALANEAQPVTYRCCAAPPR